LSEIPESKRAHVEQLRQQQAGLIADPRHYWVVVRDNTKKELGDYNVKLVALSNVWNGSAGNDALAMPKGVRNSNIVGEDSNMTYAFANPRNFSFEHSRIKQGCRAGSSFIQKTASIAAACPITGWIPRHLLKKLPTGS
jgi:hypothetical protein